MFALVFYQMRLAKENLGLIARVVYNIVTPFIYIFDFCVNWLAGPTRYWYLMCYVPMYCENLLMSGLCLWYAITRPTSAWYIVPGCLCVIVMFPLGVLIQLAYYRYWHPNVKANVMANFQYSSWSQFIYEVLQQMNMKHVQNESTESCQLTAE